MKGDEITQRFEIGGMDLRGKLFSGARWVRQRCMPTDIMTKLYMDMLDDFCKAHRFVLRRRFQTLRTLPQKRDWGRLVM